MLDMLFSAKLAGFGGNRVGVGNDWVAVAGAGAISCAVGGANCAMVVAVGVNVEVGTAV